MALRLLAILAILSVSIQAASAQELLEGGIPHEVGIGDPTAATIVVEYASLSCPHCRNFHVNYLPELKKHIADGKLYVAFRHFPLDEQAMRAAQLVSCVHPDARESYVKVLFETQADWANAVNYLRKLELIAQIGGLEGDLFKECISDKPLEEQLLQYTVMAAEQLEVHTTPTFFLNGEKIETDQFSKVVSIIDEAVKNGK